MECNQAIVNFFDYLLLKRYIYKCVVHNLFINIKIKGENNDNYTVTVNATANCLDFNMDKPTGVGKKITFAGINATGNAKSVLNNVENTIVITSSDSEPLQDPGTDAAGFGFCCSGATAGGGWLECSAVNCVPDCVNICAGWVSTKTYNPQ